MAYILTIEEVKSVYMGAASDAAIQSVIDFVALADDCLDSNSIPDAAQKLLKTYAVAHMLTVQDGGGVRSESDMDGESVTFANAFNKAGLGMSQYGALIGGMNGYSCIAAIMDKPRRSFNVVNY